MTDTESLYAAGAVTVKGATQEFGLSRAELYRYMNRGELPYSQPKKARLIPRLALRRLLAANTRGEIGCSEAVEAADDDEEVE